jgi:hypothetical protein
VVSFFNGNQLQLVVKWEKQLSFADYGNQLANLTFMQSSTWMFHG